MPVAAQIHNLSANPAYLDVACALVRAAYAYGSPLAVDLFAGGGASPLEALRVGGEAFASDLIPVACQVMLEDIPRRNWPRRCAGPAAIKAQAEQALAAVYPPGLDKSGSIAYLWGARRAENCGAEFPLVRLSQKGEAQVDTDPSRGCWQFPPSASHLRGARGRAIARHRQAHQGDQSVLCWSRLTCAPSAVGRT